MWIFVFSLLHVLFFDCPLNAYRPAVSRSLSLSELSAEMHATWQRGIEWLRAAGARVVWVSLPLTKLALPAYYLIAPAEASSNLARYDGLRFGHCFTSNYASLAKMYTDNRSAGFGPEVQRRVLLGSFALSSRAYVRPHIPPFGRLSYNLFLDFCRHIPSLNSVCGAWFL